MQDGELGTKYQPIRIGDKQYLRDSAGNVFCKTEGEKPILLPETQYRVVPRDQLKIAEPKVEFQESKVKLGNIDAQFAGFDYVVNGEKVEMWRTPDGWLVPAKRQAQIVIFLARSNLTSLRLVSMMLARFSSF